MRCPTEITMADVRNDLRYSLPIAALQLSIRAHNALVNQGIEFTGQLVQESEEAMLRTANFGRVSLNEVVEALAKRGLAFHTTVLGLPDRDTFVGILNERKVEALAYDKQILQLSPLVGDGIEVAGKAAAAVTALAKESIAEAFRRTGKLLGDVIENLPNEKFRRELDALVQKYNDPSGVS